MAAFYASVHVMKSFFSAFLKGCLRLGAIFRPAMQNVQIAGTRLGCA
jgi:hypothetical protein